METVHPAKEGAAARAGATLAMRIAHSVVSL